MPVHFLTSCIKYIGSQGPPHVPFIYKLPCLLEKHSGFHCFPYSLELEFSSSWTGWYPRRLESIYPAI